MPKFGVVPPEVPVISRLNALAPKMQVAVTAIIKDMADHGFNARVFETLRTDERQAFLYGFGRSYDDGRGSPTRTWYATPSTSSAPALSDLARTEWDHGNGFFPPTSFQISNIQAGTGAENVVPGHLDLKFNFRFSTAVTEEQLKARVEETLRRHMLDYETRWQLSGKPFLTEPGAQVEALRAAVQGELGVDSTLSTTGGTSDGRFIAPTGAQVVELGPVNATIHQIHERVLVTDLERLSRVYARTLDHLLV